MPFYNLLSCIEEDFLIKHIRIIVVNNPQNRQIYCRSFHSSFHLQTQVKSSYILVAGFFCVYFAVVFGQLKANTHLSYVNRMNLFAAVPSSGFYDCCL